MSIIARVRARLDEYQGELRYLQACIDEHMSVEIRQRDVYALRFLNTHVTMHKLVVSELERLLAEDPERAE
jgi:hypothetical protein